jgi:hypothetical protein
VRILKDFKCCVLEVFILKGLWAGFSEVRILKELGGFWVWREERGGIGWVGKEGIFEDNMWDDTMKVLGCQVPFWE